MSTFYATIQGSRGPATRCGTSNSGIKAACQSYEGSIITRGFKDREGKTMFEIETSDYSTCGYGATTVFRGTIEEFNEMCRLYGDIKSGKVSAVRHRQKKS